MEISSMRKNSFIRFAVAATAVAVLAGTAFPANAAVKPANKATIGDDCTKASTGKKAPGRGVDGTDLTCMVVPTGSYKGDNKWWYADVKPLKNIDWTIPANPGGYSLTADAITNSLKAEGLLTATTSVYKPGAGGAVGLAAFQEIKGKPEAGIITGIAMTGGLYSNKSTLNLLASTPIAKILREYEGIVVPASSKYRTLKQLMDDLVAKPNAVAIAGGNKGGVDHQTIGLLAQKAGVDPTKLNYVVYSGGPSGIKAKTFVSQGYDLVYGNWRGIMAPADLSKADYLNYIKVIDIMHISPAWKAELTKNKWDNEFAAGAAFKSFLEKHIPEINTVMKGLGI